MSKSVNQKFTCNIFIEHLLFRNGCKTSPHPQNYSADNDLIISTVIHEQNKIGERGRDRAREKKNESADNN